jgi:hypothetical protein
MFEIKISMFCTIFLMNPAFFSRKYITFYFSLAESNASIGSLKPMSLGDEISTQTSPLHNVFTINKECIKRL